MRLSRAVISAAMSYELHISRIPDWVDAAEGPIGRAEWNAYTRAKPDLREAGSIGWSDIGSEPVYQCDDRYGAVVVLSWREHQVSVTGYNGEDPAALLAIAADLDAVLVGDEGERYTIDGGSAPD